jgi:hypothetical protein
MRRAAIASVVLAALVVGACGGGSNDDKSKAGQSNAATSAKPVTITFWVGFEQRELGVIKDAVAAFHKEHPNVTVKTVGAVSDDKIIAAIRGGNAPDAVQSFSADKHRRVLLLGRLDRSQALHGPGQDRSRRLPEAGPELHAVRRHALRAADARRHLRPLLQKKLFARPASRTRRRRCRSSPTTRRS